MKKVMKQVARKGEPVVIDLGPLPTVEAEAEEAKAEEVVAEPKAEEAEVAPEAEPKVDEQPVAEPVAEEAEKHVCDDACDHAEEPAPKRSRKKQAEPSDAE